MNPLFSYMLVPLLIWLGVFGYLLWIDMRMRIVEKRLDEEGRQ